MTYPAIEEEKERSRYLKPGFEASIGRWSGIIVLLCFCHRPLRHIDVGLGIKRILKGRAAARDGSKVWEGDFELLFWIFVHDLAGFGLGHCASVRRCRGCLMPKTSC